MSYLASFIIPVLNEAECIESALIRLAPFRALGCEVIVVDGGSDDGGDVIAKPYVDKLIDSLPGRALQMNTGAAQADSQRLLFLHIDTVIAAEPQLFMDLLAGNDDKPWGYCQVKLSAKPVVFRLIEWCMNLRSRLTHIPTGDQLLMFEKTFFEKHGGFANIPLMEDVEIAKRLRGDCRPYRLAAIVITSSRRWEDNGVVKTVAKMWWLRWLFFLRVSPATLARWY